MHTLADILEQYKNPVHPAMPMTTQEAKTAIYNLLASEAVGYSITDLERLERISGLDEVIAVPLSVIKGLFNVGDNNGAA